jgi:hypothetical protein
LYKEKKNTKDNKKNKEAKEITAWRSSEWNKY